MRPTPSRTRRPVRAALVAGGLVVIAAVVVASAGALGGGRTSTSQPIPGEIRVLAEPGVPGEVLVSRLLLDASSSALVVAEDAAPADRARAVELSRTRRVPLFVVEPGRAAVVADELRRLDARTVVAVGDEIAELGLDQTVDVGRLGTGVTSEVDRPVVVLTTEPAVAADAEIGGAQATLVPVADPRADGASVAAVKNAGEAAVIGVGEQFGSTEQFVERVTLARTVPQLPGGGQLMFPSRRVVALYGSPGSRELGPLGRQDLPATVARAGRLAAQYDTLSPVPVVPGFEIIVTVASAEPGYRGAYTNVIDPSVIEPWVDAAAEAGIYVTLDLQPGRMDFLTQAKMYRRLLERPNVGLALDPEWRIKKDQVHLEQIGSVQPAEVNRTAAWLAELVRSKGLPQKAFVLHQFDADMLGDRSRLDTSHPELAVVLHADGHGTPAVKMGTWNRMTTGLPPNIWMGWKNFYSEDKPMFSPAATMDVRPVPYFISYQ
ncbi:hypothetical protein ACFQNE_13210 [Gordonia phosphorivorans]|uniref:Cell wall-binding repeat-containing protein n=1 Tax=Gordonia phosphorivorans TaxID=1056982 RepID=A0ABV6H3D6_9ACTN